MKKLKTHNLICFWLLFIFMSVTAILGTITYFPLYLNSAKISDLPGVENNFFNDFTNEKSEKRINMEFHSWNIIIPFSAWMPIFRPYQYNPISSVFAFMLSATAFPIFITKKSRKKENDNNYVKIIYFYNIILAAFIIYFMQCLIYLNCDLFEIIFNKTLYETFDKSFLIDKIGIDELNAQSKIVIDGLKDIYKAKIDGLVISSTVFGAMSIFLSIYATTFNLLFAKKMIKKSNLENQAEKLEEWK